MWRSYLCCWDLAWRSPLWGFGSVCCRVGQFFSLYINSIKLVLFFLLGLFGGNRLTFTIGSKKICLLGKFCNTSYLWLFRVIWTSADAAAVSFCHLTFTLHSVKNVQCNFSCSQSAQKMFLVSRLCVLMCVFVQETGNGLPSSVYARSDSSKSFQCATKGRASWHSSLKNHSNHWSQAKLLASKGTAPGASVSDISLKACASERVHNQPQFKFDV